MTPRRPMTSPTWRSSFASGSSTPVPTTRTRTFWSTRSSTEPSLSATIGSATSPNATRNRYDPSCNGSWIRTLCRTRSRRIRSAQATSSFIPISSKTRRRIFSPKTFPSTMWSVVSPENGYSSMNGLVCSNSHDDICSCTVTVRYLSHRLGKHRLVARFVNAL